MCNKQFSVKFLQNVYGRVFVKCLVLYSKVLSICLVFCKVLSVCLVFSPKHVPSVPRLLTG